MKLKKGGLSFVMMLILIIVAMAVVLGVSVRIFNTLEYETQNSVCEIDIAFTNNLINSGEELWGVEKLAASRITSPYCKTVVNEIDLTKFNHGSDRFMEALTIEIGEMIENCWDIFGEGRYPNTFGQNYGWDDRTNYYFPCYKFKFKSDDSSKPVNVRDLVAIDDEVGTLWTYNTQGRKIDIDFLEASDKYLNGDKRYESYLGYVYYNNNGYIEFVTDVNNKIGADFGEAGKEGAIAAGIGAAGVGTMTATGTIVGLKLGTTIGGVGGLVGVALGAGIGAGVGAISGGTVYFLSGLFYDKMVPGSGIPINDLYPEQWYEVRYYSPYVKEMDEYGKDFVFNNIKIVPLGADAGGVEVEGLI